MKNYKELLAKPAVALAALATIGAGAGIGALASAQTTTGTTATSATAAGTQQGRPERAPGVHGKITAISGTTLTVEDAGRGANATATTYTVDASAAAITKASTTKGTAPSTVTISSLAVGDEINVEGTVSGTNVAATKIMSGMMMGMGYGRGGPGMGGHGATGTVSAVSGNTITITKQDGTSYTIDATSAKVSKIVDETAADIQVGERISAEGTVSGTTVTASHIMAGIPQAPAQTTTTTTAQ